MVSELLDKFAANQLELQVFDVENDKSFSGYTEFELLPNVLAEKQEAKLAHSSLVEGQS